MSVVRKMETLSVTTAAPPLTTLAQIRDYGGGPVLCCANASVYFTVDGVTTPVGTASSEVGQLLRSTDLGIILTAEEFVNSSWVSVTGTARIQFTFLQADRRRIH